MPPDSGPGSHFLQDPQLYELLRILKTEYHLDTTRPVVRQRRSLQHKSSDTPLLNIIPALVVDRHDQSAVAFASTQGTGRALETNLYLLFSNTPHPTMQAHLRSIFSALQKGGLEQASSSRPAITESISRTMYRYSWVRWTYYLRKVLDNLQVIEDKARDLGLSQNLSNPDRNPFSSIRALGEVLSMGEEERITSAMSTISRLQRQCAAGDS
ncbi:hypothetical protein AAF712_011702 [Marasmius tenuissimus]|uniref:Uncharacterized protein n=1 Tax=Marasmius tenuissimus TaxID=585030 RepID=A0ABR2ZKJ1_9AGAR